LKTVGQLVGSGAMNSVSSHVRMHVNPILVHVRRAHENWTNTAAEMVDGSMMNKSERGVLSESCVSPNSSTLRLPSCNLFLYSDTRSQ
jgi:hypothetical protein